MSDAHPEIVIIRRGGHGEHDDHHGGVWKIAFADFMTAMMAFFLVMWLISANDKTRASVARYFNPVRLVDATTQPRGLHDTKKDESGITASPNNKKADDKKEKPGATGPEKAAAATSSVGAAESAVAMEGRLDKALREEPFAALAEIAASKTPDKARPLPTPTGTSIQGVGRGGDAYRDPFAPPPAPSSSAAAASDPLDDVASAPVTAVAEGKAADQAHDQKKREPETGPTTEVAQSVAAPASTENPTAAATASSKEVAPSAAKDTDRAADDVKVLAATLQQKAGAAGPAVSVSQTKEGVLVSLADRDNVSMFSNGSAVPSKGLILLMDEVGRLLKSRPGTIVVRGYTDAKQFRSKRYDNWHLSLDRAQVAHYMLMRGGLSDGRFDHVEGYADHAGKASLDPSDPLNRRIDILIKDAS